jgi:outer membrane protein OmpA-like peptidoglycan-associated protein
MFLENADVRIEIAGHTDSDGSEAYNQTLSEERAASVLNYLVEHGVSARRLTTVGYGETRPVVPNTSAANKAQNRRIEFTVLGQ